MNRRFLLDDTIAAIATPPGEGGLAIIRLSGPEALGVAERSFVPQGRRSVAPTQAATHTVHYGHIVDRGRVVDEVLLTVMRAPRTFTREDVAEIGCHGGRLAARAVLETVLRQGARLAEPGEFTQRAFLNGRLDLAQAEAVADLIHARTETSLAAAQAQLAGTLSARVNTLRDELMTTLAHVEAHLDFPDEDIEPDTLGELQTRVAGGIQFMDELLRTADEGRILRGGLRAAIVGRPNAGKSSLLNRLLGHDRAIVSPVPGTTRDTIEETANVRGLPVVFIDTAGLRDSADTLEQEGVRRSHASMAEAELILHVLDHAEPFAAEERDTLMRFANRKRILVRNKIDLDPRLELPPEIAALALPICCLTGQGVERLKDAIKETIWTGDLRPERLEVTINARHRDALHRARDAAQRAVEALRAAHPLEGVALELRLAAQAVGEIVGKTATEDLLDAIFREFCLGK